MLFQLINKRYEKTSTIITTNMAFGKWAEVFGDPLLANAILDRLLHHSHVFNINGKSYRTKDILENIYYGLSLMAGRIRIGDMIVCDGIRGRVTSISYTSTMLTATDGSVIAFTNSQLFAKNYQNMTRNHGWECHVLDVGVAYGTDVRKCKQLLLDAVSQLDCINKEKGVKVVLKGLGDSALVLKVLVWLRVETQYADDGIVLECIYNTLNDNKIEIPFPQTDVHMKQ